MADIIGETEIIATKVPGNNRYGQNQYTGPSSEALDKKTHTAGLSPKVAASAAPGSWQTRPVSAQQIIPLAHGARNVNESPVKIDSALSYPGSAPVRSVTK
jgi:hypothetical protein